MRSQLSFEQHRRALAAGALILAVSLAAACQSKPSEEALLKSLEPVGSWLASLQMAGEKWAANSVPSAFVKNTVSAARKAFDKADEEISKSPAGAEVRDPWRRLMAEAETATDGLERAVETGDRQGMARQTGRLAELYAAFEALRR